MTRRAPDLPPDPAAVAPAWTGHDSPAAISPQRVSWIIFIAEKTIPCGIKTARIKNYAS
jgi:hypothetical protein